MSGTEGQPGVGQLLIVQGAASSAFRTSYEFKEKKKRTPRKQTEGVRSRLQHGSDDICECSLLPWS
jgi:hypothetical protein